MDKRDVNQNDLTDEILGDNSLGDLADKVVENQTLNDLTDEVREKNEPDSPADAPPKVRKKRPKQKSDHSADKGKQEGSAKPVKKKAAVDAVTSSQGRAEDTAAKRKKRRRPAAAESTESAENAAPRKKRRPETSESTESAVGAAPRKKRRPETVEGADSAKSAAPRKKRRPEAAEGAENAAPRKKRRPETSESTESAVGATPRKKRRPETAEGAESAVSAAPRKKRRTEAAEGADSAVSAAPRKKRRPEAAEGADSAVSAAPRKKRRSETAESAERTGSGRTRSQRSGAPSGRTTGSRIGRREKKKRTYADVLKDLLVDNSLMAWLIKALFCLLLFVIVLFVVRGLRNKDKPSVDAPTDSIVSDESSLAVELTDLQKKTESFLENGAGAVDDNSITILGVGDNIVHEQVFLTAKTADGYDFRPFYTNIKSFVSSADLATVNQETPLATALGEASGYPHFNTPTEMGDALIDTGFDVANMGNNHMFDMGIDGAFATRDYWDEKNIPVTGFYYGYDDLFDFRIIDKGGIKVAFLSFVEMTNDELPSGYDAMVAYMNDKDLVKSMLEEAKAEADVVVVHAHWGDENTDITTDYVYDEAQKLVDWGADIVFGNHSHVLQDLVTLTRESDGQKCPVIYSFGNFFSAQKVRNQLVSGMLSVQVTKDAATGKVVPTAMGFLPVVTHYTGDRNNLSLYPLNMYSDELAAQHGTAEVSTEGQPMSMDYIENLLQTHIPAQYLGRMGPIDQG